MKFLSDFFYFHVMFTLFSQVATFDFKSIYLDCPCFLTVFKIYLAKSQFISVTFKFVYFVVVVLMRQSKN